MINLLFGIFALPITIAVEIICCIFAMFFESTFLDRDGVGVFKRIYREANNLLLARWWDDFSPWFQALVAAIVYYIIFF